MSYLAFSSVVQMSSTTRREQDPQTARELNIAKDSSNLPQDIVKHAEDINDRVKNGTVFTESEIEGIVHSLEHLSPPDYWTHQDIEKLRELLKEVAHLSHKDWKVTGKNAGRLGEILLKDGLPEQFLDRILKEGNWYGATEHSTKHKDEKPWAVLVTGVNGIRKTTSMYQDWFPALLNEALVSPETADSPPDHVLPCGGNSFFRQLDHIICTVCNKEFAVLYHLVNQLLTDERKPNKAIVQKYSNLKAGLFSRYRTLSELLGVVLLREARGLNCMLETSGRDVAMFKYVDEFFPDSYRKLALHFTVSDLSQAEASVDARMMDEIECGRKAKTGFDVVYANQGGPYGSDVLKGIQADSDKVWCSILDGSAGVGRKDWYTATIQINAKKDDPWTAQAVKPDGSLGTEFVFARQQRCK